MGNSPVGIALRVRGWQSSRRVAFWMLSAILLGAAISAPAFGLIPSQLSGGMRLTLAFANNTTVDFANPTRLQLSINATDDNGLAIRFAYFGAWVTESYLGVEAGGKLVRDAFGGNVTENITLTSFVPKVGVIVVTLGAYSPDNRWAVNESFQVVRRKDPSIGTFYINLDSEPAPESAGGGFFVTSYSYLPLPQGKIANVSLAYFTGEGQIVPSMGFSDDDGHDRVLFLPFACLTREATVYALGVHPEFGVAVAWTAIPLSGTDCTRPQAVAAYVVESDRENATAARSEVRIVIRLPSPFDDRNVTLWVQPQAGSVGRIAYIGNEAENYTWIAEWRTGIPIGPARFLLLASFGPYRFVWLTDPVMDHTGPLIILDPVSSALAGRSITINAYVSDVSEIQSVSLHFRVGTGQFMTAGDMERTSAGWYSGTIPAQSAGTVCYYVAATDSLGNPARNPPDCSQIAVEDSAAPSPQPQDTLIDWVIDAILLILLVGVLLVKFRQRGGGASVSDPKDAGASVRVESED